MGNIKKKVIQERQQFLNVYTEFNNWLTSIGFRLGHYWNESATCLDVHYWSNENSKDYVDSLYSVEHYINDTLKISIRFLRDRHKHEIYEVGELMERTIGIPLEEYKEKLLQFCIKEKHEKIKELNALNLSTYEK